MIRAPLARLLSRAIALALVSTSVAQSSSQNRAASSGSMASSHPTARINSSALWIPDAAFLKSSQAACQRNASKKLALCLIDEMAKAGASQQAVDFSRRLYSQNGGEFGVMWSFQALGPIDVAKVSYPLRDVGYPYAVGARSEALLLVNGNPPILDVDDLSKLDKPALEQGPSYRALKQRYRNLELWGGGRGGTMWEPVRKRPDGGQSFDIICFLNPGRPAGRW